MTKVTEVVQIFYILGPFVFIILKITCPIVLVIENFWAIWDQIKED